MEAPIYSTDGKKKGLVKLPDSVFGVNWSDALMHQVITSMQSNARPRVANARTRGEVRGGGKKPWRQKGTGRARHGSIRSPIWRGGGVTHGPTAEENRSRKISKNMRAKALFMALSRKLKEGEVIFVESFDITEPKTALAKKTLMNLSGVSGFEKLANKRANAAIIALSNPTEAVKKSYRNIGSVECVSVRDLNPLAILGKTYLVVENPEESVAILESRASKKKKEKKTPARASRKKTK